MEIRAALYIAEFETILHDLQLVYDFGCVGLMDEHLMVELSAELFALVFALNDWVKSRKRNLRLKFGVHLASTAVNEDFVNWYFMRAFQRKEGRF